MSAKELGFFLLQKELKKKQIAIMMRLRYWALVLADTMVIMHIIILALLVFNQQNQSFSWMFSDKVPSPVYITANVMPIVMSSVLYAGIFRLSARLIFMWLISMVFIWHIPAILIFFILCIERSSSQQDPHMSKRRIVTPSLWLCVWILLIIHVFKLYSELKKFKKQPQFLRTNVYLVQKMKNVSQLRAKQPGKFLVPVDSEV